MHARLFHKDAPFFTRTLCVLYAPLTTDSAPTVKETHLCSNAPFILLNVETNLATIGFLSFKVQYYNSAFIF